MFRKLILLGLLFSVLFLSVAGQNPNGYYNNASGKKKDELKTALYQIVRNHTVLDYGSLWTVFRQTDQRQDGTVWDMYSNITRTFNSYGLNREHSLPKSWWGGDVNPAYTDVNHLYPSDADANMAKSNYALGIVGNNPTFNNGVSKVGYNTYPGIPVTFLSHTMITRVILPEPIFTWLLVIRISTASGNTFTCSTTTPIRF